MSQRPTPLPAETEATSQAGRQIVAACEAMLAVRPAEKGPQTSDNSLILCRRVRRYLAARGVRADLWPGGMFRDPAWDIALELFASGLERRAVTVTDACVASRVPQTTALGCIERMVSAGMVVRSRDPHDGRRGILSLNPGFALRLRNWGDTHLCD